MRWLVLWLWVAVVGCGGGDAKVEAEAEPPTVEPIPAPEVMFAGCYEVGPARCVRAQNAQLVVWLDIQQHADIRVVADGAEIHPRRAPADGGLKLEFDADIELSRVEIQGVTPRWEAPWALELEVYQDPPFRSEAMRRFVGGEQEEAIADVERLLPSLSASDRLEALAWLAAASYAKTGSVAAERERSVVELARRLGRGHREAQSIATLIFADLLPRGELLEAESLLLRLEALGGTVDEAKVWEADRRARLADRAGDVAAALRGYERTTRLAARLNMVATELEAWKALSALHMRLSRWPEVAVALERIERLASTANIGCRNQTAALGAIGWRRLLQRAAGHNAPWPDPELYAALALAEPDGRCPNVYSERTLRINLALSHLHDDDPAGALVWLEPLDEVSDDLQPWVREIRARAGILLGRMEYVPSPLIVIDEPNPDNHWNAQVRQAQFLATIGAHGAALDAWARAEALVEAGAAELDVSAGRERFVAGRRVSAEGLVDALVKVGRNEEALCRARLARNRALRMLDLAAALDSAEEEGRRAWIEQRARYVALREQLRSEGAEDRRFSRSQRDRRRARRLELQEQASQALDEAARALKRTRIESCEGLAPIAPGVVLLLVFPVAEQWLVFAADDDGVDVVRLDTLPSGLDDLAPLEQRVVSAERVKMLPTAQAWDRPGATLPIGLGVLLEHAPIEYALDLAPRRAPSLGTRAVVIADPSQDLALARGEAEGAVRALSGSGWEVEHLAGGAASHGALVGALASADILHYAGHGESRGDAGWKAALLLADGRSLTVKDILALRAVPSRAVLTGCETGKPDSGTLEGGMSLGRALILAGAEAVLVTDGKVPDELAHAVGVGVYADGVGADWDLAASLRSVQLGLRTMGREGWAQFRVIVP